MDRIAKSRDNAFGLFNVIAWKMSAQATPRDRRILKYWKSTPKFWCKHCRTYVRDTPLEKANHEATLTHQNAVKRALRDIHRGHENEEREKERAKAEIERLNRLVPGSSSGSSATITAGKGTIPGRAPPPGPREVKATDSERKRQMEELAGLGVSIPTDFRGDMAMPGEWTVTATRVIEEKTEAEAIKAKATGVRKREVTEAEKEEEEAMKGLFKKPKKWGRGFKTMREDGDRELDALLSGDFSKTEKVENTEPEDGEVKQEEGGGDVKKEDTAEDRKDPITLKAEEGEAITGGGGSSPKVNLADIPAAPVFKKRKAKNIRQK
ncbi:hypothetical protein jhhlp_003082 [Lomentospora prolificans]|uniref:U1-type domain-containing protein n=1 Tax=Lomentospora prolificans TaxID=41688 RepID=A0A2N3NFV4_9PEZI|nr:hypothetical protein jhhlp_003082 [Lomentospora prolificans]